MVEKKKNLLVMFAKKATPGRVKTRLAKTIGEKKAATYYQEWVLRLQKEHANKQETYDFLIATSDKDYEEPHLLFSGNLGEMLTSCFQKQLQFYEKVIVIGSDVPDILQEDVLEAFCALEKHDVVIGPAVDGGYYLLGMKTYQDLFSGVSWSTVQVFSQTTAKIPGTYHVLDVKEDIDTYDELQRFLNDEANKKE